MIALQMGGLVVCVGLLHEWVGKRFRNELFFGITGLALTLLAWALQNTNRWIGTSPLKVAAGVFLVFVVHRMYGEDARPSRFWLGATVAIVFLVWVASSGKGQYEECRKEHSDEFCIRQPDESPDALMAPEMAPL
jgi:hypothetical protein